MRPRSLVLMPTKVVSAALVAALLVGGWLVPGLVSATPTTFSVTGQLTDSTTAAPLQCYVDAIDPATGYADASKAAFSSPSGTYSIIGLNPAKTYAIRTRGCVFFDDAWVGQTEAGVTAAAGDTVTVNFSLASTAAVDLTMTLLSPTEQPLDSCSLSLFDQTAGMPYSANLTTDSAGQVAWHLAPDPVVVRLNPGCGGGAETWYEAAADFTTATVIAFPTGSRDLTWHPNRPADPVDLVDPDIECASPPTVWQGSEVTIHCTASDLGSGLADSADAAFDLVTTVGSGVETDGAATGSREVCDTAGNCATAGPFTGLKVDRKAPTVSLSTPADGAMVIIGSTVTPDPSCEDGGSGTATCTAPAPSTATIGTRVITATATDGVGNSATATATITVRYGTCGLSAKSSRSGSTTITFKVCNAAGVNLSSAGLPVSAISLAGPAGPVALVAPNGTAFVFKANGRTYQLAISTGGLPRGTYQLGALIGTDPSPYPLAFRLK